jgi:hypothetical protein
VPCIESKPHAIRTLRHLAPLVAAALLAACSSVSLREPPAPVVTPRVAVARPLPPNSVLPQQLEVVRNWEQFRLQAARRLVQANPGNTYMGTPPDILLAIPVLEVELNGDGSIRRIEVLRHPGQALDTTQIAIDALRRAAPFGDVSSLPRPWRYTETFLFDDSRRFKPRTLD